MRDGTAAATRVGHLLALGRLDEAEQTARSALATEPQDVDLLVALAAVLLTAGRHGEAVIPADDAAELAPHDVLVAVDQARVLRKARRFEEAERAARRAVALDPMHADAHGALAEVHAARDAGALDPTAAQLPVTAGRVLDSLLRHLQRVLIVAVAGLGALGWSIPTGNPSRAVAGVVLGVAALLVAWSAWRLPRGSWPVVRAALSADAGAWATTAAAVLCLATFAVVAVTGLQVASASIAFVLGLGALGLLYAVGVFGALGVRWAHRRLRRRRRTPRG